MCALLVPSELPKWVPGELLCTSDDLCWNGVAQRSYRYAGQDVEVPPMRDFVVVAYRRGVTRMERRFDGAWTRTQCAPGDLSLLTRCQHSHWNWTENIDVSHVYLSESVVSGLAAEVMDRTVADVRLHDVLKTQDPVVSGIVDAITQEAQHHGMGGSLYVDALGAQLAVHMLRHYAAIRFREPRDQGCLSPLQLRRVVEYIDSRLAEALALESLAAVAGLGVWSFSRRFRASFGQAPHAYVIERRVERARRLLSQGTQSVKEVASECGFADQAHMTRLFRLRLKTTPAVLRQQATH
jgi:AraC family transcriptional regulator